MPIRFSYLAIVASLTVSLAACAANPEDAPTGCPGGAACSALTSTNALDANTATLEGGKGHWSAWYGDTIARTTETAHGGVASLRASIASGGDFGVNLDNWPGFASGSGSRTISFYARSSASGMSIDFAVSWMNSSGSTLRTDTIHLPLSTSWALGQLNVTAPTGTANVWIEVSGSNAPASSAVFLDDIYVGSPTTADAGTSDASSPDATATDAGSADAGSADAGSADSGSPDAGATDSGTPDTGTDAGAPDSGSPDSGTPDGGPSGYPTTPPAQICGNTALLSGPTTAPPGAIVIGTSDDLAARTDSAPAGSTFYLTAGVHHLALGQYSQVVPKDNDTFIGAPGAVLDGQHSNLYAFTQHASNVTIRYFTVQNFGTPGSTNNEGVVNHDGATGWTIDHMTVQGNAGAGVFVGSNNHINYNCLLNNGQYGFSAYSPDGIQNIVLDHNEIAGNNTDDWETRQPDCGCSGGGKFWATNGAVVTNNYVHDNHSVGLWADTNNVGFDISGNYISNNLAEGIVYEISYNARIANNTFLRNALGTGPTNPGFPTGAVYLSESGGDSRAGSSFSTIEVQNNHFVDNWSGVVLFENADRYCNSPANTSDGDCTLVGAASLTTCVAGTINNQPYYGDCRWKTQNVHVHDNLFELTPSNIGAGCTTANSCGVQGVFSNWGSYPSWSPYMGDVIEEAITFHQGNVFSNNQYTGNWMFMAHDQGVLLSLAGWQAAPYNQDLGSVHH